MGSTGLVTLWNTQIGNNIKNVITYTLGRKERINLTLALSCLGEGIIKITTVFVRRLLLCEY